MNEVTSVLLDDYDWPEVFEYANGMRNEPAQSRFYKDTSTEPFGIHDVRAIFWMDEGMNDAEDWIIAGALKDGRMFMLSAGCDYTGWDCQADGGAIIAGNMHDLVYNCMTDTERRRFGIRIVRDGDE